MGESLKYVKKNGRKGMERANTNDTKGILVLNHLSNRRKTQLSLKRLKRLCLSVLFHLA